MQRKFNPIFLILLAFLSFFIPFSNSWADDAFFAFINGDVRIKKEGAQDRTVRLVDTVKPGEAVVTGNDTRVEISFPDKSFIRLGSNTSIKFTEDKKGLTLESGAILFYVPEGTGKVRIATERVRIEAEGATAMVEHTPSSYAKFIVVAGQAQGSINERFGEWITLEAGKMLILPPDSRSLPEPVDVDLFQLVRTSALINLKGDKRQDINIQLSRGIKDAVREQQASISKGSLIKTNMVIISDAGLVIASENMLKTLENRAIENWQETRTSEPLTLNNGLPFSLGPQNNINMAGHITKAGIQTASGQVYENYPGDISRGGYANYIFGRSEYPFEHYLINFNNRFGSRSPIATFLFNELNITGDFDVSVPPGVTNRLSLVSKNGINVTGQIDKLSPNLAGLSMITSNGPININKSVIASIAPRTAVELAMETQGRGQYVGVDKWEKEMVLPVGGIYVNATDTKYENLSSAASEYLAPDATREASKTGGLVDARTYNYAVQVGPYRNMNENPPSTPFHYGKYVARYEVTRPLPVAYSKVENNPQFGSGFTGGQPTEQYRALFNRSDLIRLGYLKKISYDANDTSTLDAQIKPFSDYATTYISSAELEQKVKAAWEEEMSKRTPEQQAEAKRLNAQAREVMQRTTNRTGDGITGDGTADSKTIRSYQEFFAYASGSGSSITLAKDQSLAGFGMVTLAAEKDLYINGSIAGAENFYGISGAGDIIVPEGGLIEVFTDNRATGGGTANLTAQKKIELAGRIQASSAPQNYYNRWQKTGAIDVKSKDTSLDPDSIAINITSSGQLLALINSASYKNSDAGRARVDITALSGKIRVDGLSINGENYGKNIVADYGDLNIINNGTKGTIDILNGAGLLADIIKIKALGTQGVLNIYAGSSMDANTQIVLYGGQFDGGKVIFTGSGHVNLTSGSGGIIVGADTVQVNTSVNVNTGSIAADVYANKRNWNPVCSGQPCGRQGSPQAGTMGTWSIPPSIKGGASDRPNL